MIGEKEPRARTRGRDKTALLQKFFQAPYYPKAEDLSILISIAQSNANTVVCALAKGLIRQIENRERGGVAA